MKSLQTLNTNFLIRGLQNGISISPITGHGTACDFLVVIVWQMPDYIVHLPPPSLPHSPCASGQIQPLVPFFSCHLRCCSASGVILTSNREPGRHTNIHASPPEPTNRRPARHAYLQSGINFRVHSVPASIHPEEAAGSYPTGWHLSPAYLRWAVLGSAQRARSLRSSLRDRTTS